MTSTAMPRDVAAWVTRLPEETYNQLAEVGLLEQRAALLLGPFLEGWMGEREGEKVSTRITWGNAQRNLLEFFGPEKPLREITEADAEAFAPEESTPCGKHRTQACKHHQTDISERGEGSAD